MAKRVAISGRQLLFGLLLLLLSLPAIQTWLNIKVLRTEPLTGYQAPAPRPTLHWDSLRAGTYQPALERYATDHLGLHDRLIRPRNELSWLLFGQIRARDVVQGEDGVLFEEGPIRSYLGENRVSDEAIKQNVARFRAVQDTLARRGKLLVFVVAPSKAAFFPELLPAAYRTGWRQPSNAERYAPALQAAGVHLLDFGRQFRTWKDTAAHPLFPRYGIHWSLYGVTEAAKVLFPYLEQQSHFRLPGFRTAGLEVTTTPRYTDNDLARLMNLVWEPTGFAMAYPDVVFDAPRPGQLRPRLLLIGDSFAWNLIQHYTYFDHLFDQNSHFWYYNQQVEWRPYTGALAGITQVSQLDYRAQLLAHDVVIVLFNEHNLVNFDAGFSERALQAFAPGH